MVTRSQLAVSPRSRSYVQQGQEHKARQLLRLLLPSSVVVLCSVGCRSMLDQSSLVNALFGTYGCEQVQTRPASRQREDIATQPTDEKETRRVVKLGMEVLLATWPPERTEDRREAQTPVRDHRTVLDTTLSIAQPKLRLAFPSPPRLLLPVPLRGPPDRAFPLPRVPFGSIFSPRRSPTANACDLLERAGIRHPLCPRAP